MGNTVTNVTTGKPKVGGAVYVAPIGTTPPADAVTALDAAFKCLGYVSEDGVKNSASPNTDTVKAWGGDTVLNTNQGRDDTFTFTLIEALNSDVLKFVYGSANVTGTWTGTSGDALDIAVNGKDTDDVVVAIDMIQRGGILKRIVMPCAHVTDVGEIAYTDSDAVGYETTVTCQPDASGDYHHEYIAKQ